MSYVYKLFILNLTDIRIVAAKHRVLRTCLACQAELWLEATFRSKFRTGKREINNFSLVFGLQSFRHVNKPDTVCP
jgi:hypothetical protein